MKKILLAVIICILTASCIKNTGTEDITLESPSEVILEKGGSYEEIAFKAGWSWTASVDQEWIKLSLASGPAGSLSIRVSAEENEGPERDGYVTVTLTQNQKFIKVHVTQRGTSE